MGQFVGQSARLTAPRLAPTGVDDASLDTRSAESVKPVATVDERIATAQPDDCLRRVEETPERLHSPRVESGFEPPAVDSSKVERIASVFEPCDGGLGYARPVSLAVPAAPAMLGCDELKVVC